MTGPTWNDDDGVDGDYNWKAKVWQIIVFKD